MAGRYPRVGGLVFGCLAVLAVGAGFLLGSRQPPDRLVFVSVGQGDCAIFESHGHTILIDDGPATPQSDAGKRIVVPELKRLGVDSVDAILLSHPDEDHVGGTPALLRDYPGAKVVMSAQFRSDPAMDKHLAKWGLPVARVIWLSETATMKVGAADLQIECPPMKPSDPDNNGSMFVHLVDGGGTAAFSGDAPISVERFVEGSGDWRSEILKAGHHGSRTASDESWIETVHPTYAVISVGRNNHYGHPNREVLDRLTQDGVTILRTDQDGDIEFDYDGKTFIKQPSGG